ncbi:APC family permease [Flavitalea sp. BT771]|uniref:APC family permease n=1 Tax=Flavitalea sp. BT771 TaxID=3063329 RepID=UPI0026E33A83|nr:APC family permease [Flavitalea sp. BT771]MDO6431977.1 APC family permease [Flavitalea sp. BT771]MDV6220886.1 APC family permease [Flavitalea sp. BT771]
MPSPQLKREIGLLQATSINMIDMVGIGPFVMLSLVIQIVGSNLFLWAWIFGAVTALVDGAIWAELGAAYPLAGGSYNFLKAAYGKKWGPLMSFLFVWQTCLQAPLVVASGAIGFSHYFGYLVPLGEAGRKAVSGTIVVLIVLLLYRNIKTIGKISVFLWAGVIITMLWIIISGFMHRTVPFTFMPSGDQSMFTGSFAILLGQASGKTIYSYLGYYNVCHLGGEIREPGRNIPRSIFISIICIAVLYLCMNLSVVGVIPWQEAMHSDFVISMFMEKIYGHRTAMVATGLVLWVAFASLFAVVLGYSRVPYAAAVDGHFFPFFARLHPTKAFPYVSLLFIGALGFLFSIQLKLEHAISAILAMRILVQFVAQAVGVVVLRRREGTRYLPFRMWLYPLPVILSVGIWLFVWGATGKFAFYGLALAAIGVIVFYVTRNRWKKIT